MTILLTPRKSGIMLAQAHSCRDIASLDTVSVRLIKALWLAAYETAVARWHSDTSDGPQALTGRWARRERRRTCSPRWWNTARRTGGSSAAWLPAGSRAYARTPPCRRRTPARRRPRAPHGAPLAARGRPARRRTPPDPPCALHLCLPAASRSTNRQAHSRPVVGLRPSERQPTGVRAGGRCRCGWSAACCACRRPACRCCWSGPAPASRPSVPSWRSAPRRPRPVRLCGKVWVSVLGPNPIEERAKAAAVGVTLRRVCVSVSGLTPGGARRGGGGWFGYA
jgi:hypothetical protein